MKKNNRAWLRRYLRSVRSMLPCSGTQKKRILEEIRCNASTFLEDQPDADPSQLQTHFGTPEQIAASYVDNMDMSALLKTIRIKKRIFTTVVAAVLAILISWACTVTWAIIESNDHDNGYFTVIID